MEASTTEGATAEVRKALLQKTDVPARLSQDRPRHHLGLSFCPRRTAPIFKGLRRNGLRGIHFIRVSADEGQRHEEKQNFLSPSRQSQPKSSTGHSRDERAT